MTDSLTFPAGRHAYPTSFGASCIDPHRTHFRLWAPACQAVSVELDDGERRASVAMTARDGGWFDATVPFGPGTRYRYRLDGGEAVPDPASRFQPEGVHGPSQVIDPGAYRWRQDDWRGRPWHETVLYELHVGALGGYRGVAQRLGELAALGVTAIELMPLAECPGTRNWGYDGVLPFAPSSSYGRPEELKALVDAAHELGLQVFVDVVYNHFGPDGNWLARYAPPFFREGKTTGWGPAIDFQRDEVGRFFIDNALYWLEEYRIDGLRIDAAHAIDDDRWLGELAARVRAYAGSERHVHLVLENERNSAHLLADAGFDAQWNDDFHNSAHVLLTGERDGYYRAYADAPLQRFARTLAEGFAYQGEPSPLHDGRPRGEPSAHLPPTAFVAFLQNHDQIGNRAFGERLRAMVNDETLRAATAVLLLAPSVPLLFMGEETGSTQPFQFFTDYEGELADAVREGRRREFAAFPAFENPERRHLIPDPNDPATFARSSLEAVDADHESDDARSWRAFYRGALAVRNGFVVPHLPGTRSEGVSLLDGGADAGSHAPAHDDPRGGDPGIAPDHSRLLPDDPEQPAERAAAATLAEAIERDRASGEDDQATGTGRAPRTGAAPRALVARWRLGNGARLAIALNLDDTPIALAEPPPGKIVFETPPRVRDALVDGRLGPHACLVWLDAPAGAPAEGRGR
ncbi:malto-oligosyltrehalose trehalohydrolase [Burkholderia plantarii]|uniref:Malto-oligosyltrehalose trehalohydrolase n=1 Tax=Burkholderia plantarii TaxID=41899 RepID=A0A0B6S6K3_BURPL|nr:malto-oligosyltrehalose trehalohydrolase [Burkholderia plantarii]AJK48905.1 malto-oligosyltrehalose trehalohydrolase TreZ [Burkholderia plantarii]